MKLPEHATPENCTKPQDLRPGDKGGASQKSEHGGTVQTGPQKTLPNVVTNTASPSNHTTPQSLRSGK